MSDRLIRLQDAIEACWKARESAQMLDDSKSADKMMSGIYEVEKRLKKLSSVAIVHCKECQYYIDGYCESDDMWRNLYGETYEVEAINRKPNDYCSYGKVP